MAVATGSTPNYIGASSLTGSTTLTSVEKAYIAQLLSLGVNVWALLADQTNDPMGFNWYNTRSPMILNPTHTKYYSGNVVDQAKAYYKDANLDFDGTLISALRSNGISINVTTGASTITTTIDPLKNPLISGSNLSTAIQNGGDIQATAMQLLSQLDLGGNSTSRVASFFADSSNNDAIKQAVTKLNYPVPTSTDVVGISQMKQLYWASYYLSEFPIPENATMADCATVLQTIQSLKDTFASVQQQQSTSTADAFFNSINNEDLQIQLQVVTDLQRVFNALNSKLACTKTESIGGSNLVTWVVIGFTVVIGVLVVKKIFHKQAA